MDHIRRIGRDWSTITITENYYFLNHCQTLYWLLPGMITGLLLQKLRCNYSIMRYYAAVLSNYRMFKVALVRTMWKHAMPPRWCNLGAMAKCNFDCCSCHYTQALGSSPHDPIKQGLLLPE